MKRNPSPIRPAGSALPKVSRALIDGFARYTRWYLPRHLHSIRLSLDGWMPSSNGASVRIVYLNHASWWDPLVCLHLWDRFFRPSPAYALIDAAALTRYPFFRRLGFIGVQRGSRSGAASFLRATNALLAQPGSMLWVTPQAKFCDVRQRPLAFEPGLTHLAARIASSRHEAASTPKVEFVPLAIEYTHWHERTPEVLVRFGRPFDPADAPPPASTTSPASQAWNQDLERRLTNELDALAILAQARDPNRFQDILRGKSGVGGIYDGWRRLRAALRRRQFTPHHGTL